MEKRWELAGNVDSNTADRLRDALHVPSVVARLLVQRGLTTPEAAEAFFHPSREGLYDPFLFTDMDAAAERIVEALREKQRIVIYGDYDVDGITATSLLYLFFRELGGDICYYIPNRQAEGYGLSLDGIQFAVKEKARLLVTVDCGVTAVAESRQAREAGLDVIISDHHQPGPELPEAVAVINPKVEGSGYPFTELAGVGVAFKLAQGVLRRLDLDPSYLDKHLDLVAVGTSADIVPMVEENRIFVRLGLEKLSQDPQTGLRTLIETANLRHGRASVTQIVYGVAPRINAVGRMGSADPAIELLITGNVQRALHLASILETENRRRRAIDSRTLEEALQLAGEQFEPERDSALVLAQENWHSGVIGIVASRLIERFYRPTVMISVENGIGKGSARSIPGFDLYRALEQCQDLLLEFGGHTYAAGLSIEAGKIPELRRRLNEVAAKMLGSDDLV
ncbi:MAG TPA: single-stranded-DNA-specific exonuclease RecJ, partial [Bacteroidetes bacterium]|nr:single-stranded-DNA-specific exonuclease RecJ [Bacteroidota bacterium]